MSERRIERERLDTLQGTLVARLAGQAMEAMSFARAPLSGYRVGAAIVADSGDIVTGCNVEFGNYSNTLHAEEVAIGNAIAAGLGSLRAIAVATRDLAWPCGMCRQSLSELGIETIIATDGIVLSTRTMEDLLPEPFELTRGGGDAQDSP